MNRTLNTIFGSSTQEFRDPKFLEYFFSKAIDFVRLGILLAFLLYGLFGILDSYMAPNSSKALWVIRFLIVMPLLSIGYWVTGTKNFVRHSTKILFAVSLIVGLGVVAIIAFTKPDELANRHYFSGLLLCIFFTHSCLYLKPAHALCSSVLIVLAYDGFRLIPRGITKTENIILMINENFFLISSIILGMFISISIQNFFRKTYVQAENIKHEKAKLEKANLDISDLSLTKSKALAVLSHDMRAPMTSVKGMLELYDLNFVSEQEFRKSVPQLICAVSGAGLLFENLLRWSVSQMENKKENKKYFLIRDLVENVFSIVLIQAEKKSTRLVNSVDRGLIGWGNPTEIELVIRNLVSNAVKFTKNGCVEVSSRQNENVTEVIVKDTGAGMSQQMKNDLFSWGNDSPRTVSESERGMGIGLAICKDLVEHHGGKLFFSTHEGQGSEFYFTLPMKEDTNVGDKSKQFNGHEAVVA